MRSSAVLRRLAQRWESPDPQFYKQSIQDDESRADFLPSAVIPVDAGQLRERCAKTLDTTTKTSEAIC